MLHIVRILVVSDTHGDDDSLRKAIEEQPQASWIIHLGDGMREASIMTDAYPERHFIQVCGNCDWALQSSVPQSVLEILGGKRIFLTHGHCYDVKMGLYRVVCAAREQQADILLFGHTHQPMVDYDEALHIMNPGSLAHGGSYGLIDITSAGIVPILTKVRS